MPSIRPLRQLGNSDLQVAPLAFGGNVFGWTADEAQSFRLLDQFVASGFNFIDTADVYSRWAPGHTGGESETIIGRWLKARGKRDDVIIATKVGMEMGPSQDGLSKAYIYRAVDASLARLHTDFIDLYQSHRDDVDTPLVETLEAYDYLMKAGKIRFIGASNYKADRLEEAMCVSAHNNLIAYQSVQPLYNLYDRFTFEGALEAVCERHHLGVINFYALASGFLTGKYRSESDFGKSARGTKAGSYLTARGKRILAALDAVSSDRGLTIAQVAIAWLLTRPGITAPIASATTVDQLDEILVATTVELDAQSIAQLTEASDRHPGDPEA